MVNGKSAAKIFILAFLIGGVLIYKNHESQVEFDLSNLPPLKKGDLIFRLGNSKDSLVISALSDFKYSHIGVIIDDSLVIHSAPATDINTNDGVSIITLDDFLLEAVDFGIGRVKFLDENSSEIFIENLKSNLGKNFKLENKDGDSLYCTTLIANELGKISDFTPEYQYVNIPFVGGEYLFPAGIYRDNSVEIIYEYR